jgi:hypothetical protein
VQQTLTRTIKDAEVGAKSGRLLLRRVSVGPQLVDDPAGGVAHRELAIVKDLAKLGLP